MNVTDTPATEAARTPGAAAVPRRLPRMPGSLATYWQPAMVLAVLVGLWELGSRREWLPAYVFPAPSSIAETLWVQRSMFWHHAQVTLIEVALGFALGMLIGVVVGTGIALVTPVRNALYPLVVASQSLPTLALAPILVLWLGFGILPKVVIVVQVVFFPTAVATITGLTSVNPEILVFGRSLGARAWSLFWKIRVPATLPFFFGGAKVSASYAAIAAIIGEWMGAERGLGALMLRANNNLATEIVFGCLVLITTLGLTFFGAATLLERRFVPQRGRAS